MIPRRAAVTPARSRAALQLQRPPTRLDRNRLPDPLGYYSRELGTLKGRGAWRDAVCPFHEDTRPSLRVNVESGGWRCMACGRGGDVIKFHMMRHGLDFPAACRALGCWAEGRRYG